MVTPASLLFDNRMNYLQSTLDVNFRLSAHTTLTFGGDGFGVWRKATGLIGMEGYTLRGAIDHRVTQRTTLGVNYEHTHFDFPKAFGQSDLDSFAGTFATQIGRSWIFSLQGGAYVVEVEGLQQVAVAPEIAALLGVQSATQTFYQKSVFPQWNATLSRKFHRASLSFQYQSGATGGNGVYLTSRQDTGSANYSYTAARKWSFTASAGYFRLQGIGQDLQPYSQFIGSSGVTYALTHADPAVAPDTMPAIRKSLMAYFSRTAIVPRSGLLSARPISRSRFTNPGRGTGCC